MSECVCLWFMNKLRLETNEKCRNGVSGSKIGVVAWRRRRRRRPAWMV